jgi:GH18 family chitinase
MAVQRYLMMWAAVAVMASAPLAQSPPASLEVIGYYADWLADTNPLAAIPADKLTHVNYAFGKIGPDNRLTWNAAIAVNRSIRGTAPVRVARMGCSIRSRCSRTSTRS